ncbi:hypothetical protein BC937DRAFT_92435 [Endogone sp. FLAS-F59071]|nr:hypothetical protein BC937DRAFT_92435 [Endogone sp. FLAS-F59071]|eukprot:RUS21523.1 hypothetical protein BC937DRAFT_92435 [Endogone sp. FLAS-F59071]
MSSRPAPLETADPNDFFKPDEIEFTKPQHASHVPDNNNTEEPSSVYTSDSVRDDPVAVAAQFREPSSPRTAYDVLQELSPPPQTPAVVASPLPLTPAIPISQTVHDILDTQRSPRTSSEGPSLTSTNEASVSATQATNLNARAKSVSTNKAAMLATQAAGPAAQLSQTSVRSPSSATARTTDVHQTPPVSTATAFTEPSPKPSRSATAVPTQPSPSPSPSNFNFLSSSTAPKSGTIHHTASPSGSRPLTSTDQDLVNPIRTYNFSKHSLLDPQNIDIFDARTKQLLFRKIQHHSYSWGFHNAIVAVGPSGIDSHPRAEARRAAFQKPIHLSWFDPNATSLLTTENPPQTPITPSTATVPEGPRNTDFVKLTSSNVLFSYEFRYEGYLLRWTRASLLSHDMSCELVGRDERTGKETLRMAAEFDSQAMGYLRTVGKLKVWESVFGVMEEPKGLEAVLLLTCCTLIDLMREVVEKVVGIGGGGVAVN